MFKRKKGGIAGRVSKRVYKNIPFMKKIINNVYKIKRPKF